MKNFKINQNKYLNSEIQGFYHCDYVGYQKEGNPDFINHLKNPSKKSEMDLVNDFIEAFEILKADLSSIVNSFKQSEFSVCCVPRSKAESKYMNSQLMFKKVVSCVATDLDLIDATGAIVRIKDTETTHNWRMKKNTGDAPYVGITKETCKLDEKYIRGKKILLVDDVYTKGVNVVEDCVQTLLDFGAQNVVVYTLAKVA